ncbi:MULTISPECIES: GspE/PulE family protein [Pseudoalteromonas]|uniref:GspE/PulE family protein n=1 Tax=Pseudoalteromonas TaxID=53246 RepID=UPI001581A43F|nr:MULTISPECIES: ATPase, T2SS/T4P/T4SS family [Pseudoalteromonas]MDI4652086.1 GspE/PulE family protein [Pseudoalteromonas shioyasakiensis]NUJ38411.1 type II/IV secretion system protein [Pseudoalteromonas sp. 0303]
MTKLETLLVNSFGINNQDLSKALSFQDEFGGKLELILENMGVIDEGVVAEIYATYFDLPLIDVDKIDELLNNADSVSKISEGKAYKLSFIETNDTFLVAEPFESSFNNYISNLNPEEITIYITKRSDIEHISKDKNDDIYNEITNTELDKLKEAALEAPVVNLLNSLIQKGLKLGASDMHIEPVNSDLIVRYRVDGVLKIDEKIARSLQMALITRLKILSNMDIAEKRRPQDGKIAMRISGEELDLRVSCLPLANGESFVLRFLRSEALAYDLNSLGIEADTQQELEKDIQKTSGVVLLTGPTGSGKTTTLYSFLSKLNSEKVKIITLEDPVEYQLENINQVQINTDIGFDFADGLRSIVRQDPDIIMLGEIRDKKTAQIALQSALTGHLVFSTVHTNDAASAYTRLIDLGVDEFLLEAALISIVAQRLARKLCSHCSIPDENAELKLQQPVISKLIKEYNLDLKNSCLHEPVGCNFCSGTGYKGRVALIEYLKCNEELAELDKDAKFLSKARKLNKENGFRNLLADGILKALKGQTTIEEVLRVAG